MIVTIKNLTNNQMSTDVGVLAPGESKSAFMTPDRAYASADGLKTLQDAGRVLVSVTDESTRLDSMDPQVPSTTKNMALYVSSTGSDTNPGTSNLPFKTIQKAVDSIPKRVRHQVDVNIGVGSFPGFNIVGFSIDPALTTPAGLRFTGTLASATVATGTNSGAFTAVSAGSATTAAMATLTDSGQTWTVDNLRGKYLEILTGTSAGQILVITSNTATILTIASNSAIGSIGGTYAIRDQGTIISTGASQPNSLPAPGAAAGAAVTRGMNVYNNFFNINSPTQMRFDFIKFAPTIATASTCVNYQSPGAATFARCTFGDGATSSNSVLSVGGPVQLSIQQCFLEGTASAGNTINITGAGCIVLVATSAIFGGTLNTGVNNQSTGDGNVLSITGTVMQTGTPINLESQCRVVLSGSRITATNARCILARPNSATGGNNVGVFIQATGLFLENGSAGVELQGLHMIRAATLLGSGHTIAIVLQRGARAEIGSASTITGTTEVTLDGVSTTLATMRAASPKLVTNTYGTIIYE